MAAKDDLIKSISSQAVMNACEWDDRTSPEGYEEYMFMTPDELEGVISEALNDYERERPSLAFTLDKARQYAQDQKDRINSITDPVMRDGVIASLRVDNNEPPER